MFRSRSSARVTAGTSVAAPTWRYNDMTLALVSTLTSARGTESRLRVVILCTEARARSTASSWSRVRWQYLVTWGHGENMPRHMLAHLIQILLNLRTAAARLLLLSCVRSR